MKSAALFTVAAALLTVLAPHNASAAPKDNAPIVSPLVSAKTVQFTMKTHGTYVDNNGKPQSEDGVDHTAFQKPGKAFMVASNNMTENGIISLRYVSDGKTATLLDTRANTYEVSPPSPNDDILPHIATIPAVKPVSVMLNKRHCLFYTLSPDPDVKEGQAITQLWIDAATHLPVREIVTETHADKTRSIVQADYTDWKLNANLPASLFVFVPPPGSKLKVAEKEEDYGAKFLKPGTQAPDFTAYDGNSKAVKLSDYAGKVVLIDLWATWCGPCQRALPEINALAKKYAGQVVTLGANIWDEQAAFADWLPAHKSLDSITFVRESGARNDGVTGKAYGIVAIPSQYIVGKDGKVAAAFCVAAPGELTAALDKAVAAVPVTP